MCFLSRPLPPMSPCSSQTRGWFPTSRCLLSPEPQACSCTLQSAFPLDSAGVGLGNMHSLAGWHTLSTGVVATQCPWRMMHAQKGPCECEGGTEGYARAQFGIRVPGPASHLLSSVLHVLNFGITAKMRTPWRRGALPCARDLQVQPFSDPRDRMRKGGGGFHSALHTCCAQGSSGQGLQLWYLPDIKRP